MLTYKIVSDWPHRRRRTSSFPEQLISEITAKEITKPVEQNPTDLEGSTDEKAINWFELGQSELIAATEVAD